MLVRKEETKGFIRDERFLGVDGRREGDRLGKRLNILCSCLILQDNSRYNVCLLNVTFKIVTYFLMLLHLRCAIYRLYGASNIRTSISLFSGPLHRLFIQ